MLLKKEPLSISIIVAFANNRVIGNKDKIPWKLSEDLKHFRSMTLGRAVIFGYNTFSTLPAVMDNRLSIVLSRKSVISGNGNFKHAMSVEESLSIAHSYYEETGSSEVFIAGGEKVYKEFLPLASKLYITEVNLSPDGDYFFPSFKKDDWLVSAANQETSKGGINYRFLTYSRI